MERMLNDEEFEKIHHSVNMLHSLQNSHDTVVMNREEVDEKVFDEIGNFEVFIKHLEGIFLETIDEDMQAISKAAVLNPGSLEKAEELINGINGLIESFNRMESEYISKSESLKSMGSQLRSRLILVKKEMESKIKQHKKYNNALNIAILGPKTHN